MDLTRDLHKSQRAGAQAPDARDKAYSAETSRRDKSNMGFETIGQDLESTAGMQYLRVQNMDQLYKMYDLHSGKTSTASGCPRVTSLSKHFHCPSGRRKMDGDFKTGCGGKHPLSPEFMFNGKTEAGLAFGAADLNGAPLHVIPEQFAVRTYFDTEGYFHVPQLERTCCWVCTCPDMLTPFDMPLARPLQGTVVPGESLMKCFAEKELRKKNTDAGIATPHVDWHSLVLDQGMHNRMRSLATRKDEHLRKMDLMLANSLRSYDLMTQASSLTTGNSDVTFNPNASDDEANYVIKTLSMTTKISREVDRLYEYVVAPWIQQNTQDLNTSHRKLLEANIDPKVDNENGQVKAYFEERALFNRRHNAIKKDLTQYLLRLLKTCFLSAKDAATVPTGYRVRTDI